MTVTIYPVTGDSDESPLLMLAAKNLISAYYSSLENNHNMDMTYQGVQEELDSLPGKFDFGKRGGLWVATCEDDGEDGEVITVAPGSVLPGGATKFTLESFVGVVALRPLGDGADSEGEVKRMFVSDAGRRKGVAFALSDVLVAHAEKLGDYEVLKLDSLERLPGAVALYEKIGFRRCEKYVECPESDHLCMEMVSVLFSLRAGGWRGCWRGDVLFAAIANCSLFFLISLSSSFSPDAPD